MNLGVLSALLGHPNAKMTMRSAHLSPEAQADAGMVLEPAPRNVRGASAGHGIIAGKVVEAAGVVANTLLAIQHESGVETSAFIGRAAKRGSRGTA